MSTYTNLKLEKCGHTAVLTLSNPPANTWTREALADLTRLVKDLNADREIYTLVVTGEGEKFFSAGADLKLFADGDKAMAREMARNAERYRFMKWAAQAIDGDLRGHFALQAGLHQQAAAQRQAPAVCRDRSGQ